MQRLEIAKIVKPQGLRGEVKAVPLTNVLAVFHALPSAFVGDVSMPISHIGYRQGFVYIQFVGIDDRMAAETLRNKMVSVDKEVLLARKDDQTLLIDDIIGIQLYDTDGAYVGQIVNVENHGACDIFIIEADGRTGQAPYVEEVFIKMGETFVVDRKRFDEVCIW